MKILKIEIKNLASLDGHVEIDLNAEPLKSAGLFIITGPTGAGKSTILDAICLSLYGTTPRYEQGKERNIDIMDISGKALKQNDVRAILREGTTDGYALIKYLGNDNHIYSSSWNVRRARNKPDGELQPASVSLFDHTLNKIIADTKTDWLENNVRLTGLTFAQFTRSVLLPQNDFTAFLKAKEDDRAELLEKLTGTQHFTEISKAVYNMYFEQENHLKQLKEIANNIEFYNETERTTIYNSITQLENELVLLYQKSKILNKHINWYTLTQAVENDILIARNKHNIASKVYQEAQSRITNLKIIDGLLPLRSIYEKLLSLQTNVDRYQKEKHKYQENLNLIKSEIEVKEKIKFDREKKYVDLKNKEKEYKILFSKAKELDIRLSVKTQQCLTLRDEIERKNAFLKLLEENKNDITKKLNNLVNEAENIKTWYNQFQERKKIVDNFQYIEVKLQQAEKLYNQISALQKIKNVKDNEIQLHKNYIYSLESKEHDINTKLTKLQNKKLELEKNVPDQSLEVFHNRRSQQLTRLKMFEKAIEYWKNILNINDEIHDIEIQIKSLHEKISVNYEELNSIDKEIPICEHKINTLKYQIQEARLLVSENIVALRNHLVEGSACPVCGSTEHPYLITIPKKMQDINPLEKQLQENELTQTNLLKNQVRLNELIKNAEEIINNKNEILKKLYEKKNNIYKEWQNLEASTECAHIDDFNKLEWLNQQYSLVNNEYDATNIYYANFNEIIKLQNEITTIENQLKNLQEQKFLAYSKLNISENDNKRNESEITSNLNDYSKLIEEINPYFSSSSWHKNWEKDPKKFFDILKTFYQDWKEKEQRLDEISKQIIQYKTELKNIDENFQNTYNDILTDESKYNQLNDEKHDLQNNRSKIFNGEDVTSIEMQLEQNIELITNEIEKLKDIINTLTNQKIENETLLNNCQHEITRLNNQIKQTHETFIDTLNSINNKNGFNLDETMAIEYCTKSDAWIEQEKREIEIIEKQYHETKNIVDSLEKKLNDILVNKPSDILLSYNQLTDEIELNEKLIKEKNEEKIRLKTLLEQDNLNRSKYAEKLKEIEHQQKITENWKRLNELIGQADGQKFRKIAQQYTLDLLIYYSNSHLNKLSNRYQILRIPNTMGLQIIDRYMGDDIRSVYSLSGGESFIISLALALGLASLSSEKVKVESLFIDEGFGSLDQNTLSIVMDTLEKLQNTGRKVGIISHVHEMSERIPIQIRVIKLPNGKSRVEVVGF